MPQNASECLRLPQNASECFSMLQNASECLIMPENASECKCVRLLLIASECLMLHNAAECLRGCFRMPQNALKLIFTWLGSRWDNYTIIPLTPVGSCRDLGAMLSILPYLQQRATRMIAPRVLSLAWLDLTQCAASMCIGKMSDMTLPGHIPIC